MRNHPLKTILSALIAVVVAVGLAITGLTGTANAGTYWTSSTCAHSAYTKFICFDAGSDTIVIQTAVGAQTGYAAGSAMTPTKGYIAYDVFECNASAPGYDTGFTTSGLYNLPTSVLYVVDDGGPPSAGFIYTSQSTHDLIAWLANSQSGYACFIVT